MYRFVSGEGGSMLDLNRFATLLGEHVRSSGISLRKLGQLSGVPHTTLQRWIDGSTAKPQSWKDLVRVLHVLKLGESAASEVLQVAGFLTIPELIARAETSEEKSLLSPWAKTVVRRLGQAMDAVDRCRMQAQHWKQLHEEWQRVNKLLATVRGYLPFDVKSIQDAQRLIELLELDWQMQCSGMLRSLAALEAAVHPNVIRIITDAEKHSGRLAAVLTITIAVDQIVDSLRGGDDLIGRRRELDNLLRRLELRSIELLEFFDARLRDSLNELEVEMAHARTSYLQADVFVDA
jgi:hypothetical protein